MSKLCVCGNPDCDSPFHKGDKVEIQWGDRWIVCKVVSEARTRVTVEFPHPIFFTEKTVKITKNFWGKRSTTEEWSYKILKCMTLGVAYIRFPETKNWDRP